MPSEPDTPSVADAIRLAAPASLAAMATPLLGLVDVWALGQSSRPLDIAAVGLGAVIFSLTYWTFGFIRMGVAGLAAQAVGAEDEAQTRAVLGRGLILGGALGLALVLLQWPLERAAFALLSIESEASEATFAGAATYFRIRIWGAPVAVATYALFGWLTARGRTDYLMAASLSMTAVNIALDYWLVVELDRGAAGVALGTLIAEIVGFAVAAALTARLLGESGGIRAHWGGEALLDPDGLRRTVAVNRDIFIRTLLLAASFAWFTQRGGGFGDVTLAANQALLQLFLFTGLALDGTAIAAETMVGQALGDRDQARGQRRLDGALRATSLPAAALAVVFALVYAVFGADIAALLTDDGPIRATAARYMPWVAVSPLVLVGAFQLDGIFIGATRAREMRNGMIVSTGFLIPASILLADAYGNHGLWAAFTLYFALRGLTLAVFLPRVRALAS
ncbi:MAG: MATE family efflux transporter [Pseudomonadota bacterium]